MPLTTAGPRAPLLPERARRRRRRGAPLAVKEIIAAGNQIAGKPYVYGGGHGLPLSEIAPAYDCSSSVEHLLYGARLLPVDYDAASGTLESFGQPGPGQWVTLYASADHVFMYVAGLRWDTHNAAGAGRREHRHRLASARPQRRRVRGAAPGGAVTGRASSGDAPARGRAAPRCVHSRRQASREAQRDRRLRPTRVPDRRAPPRREPAHRRARRPRRCHGGATFATAYINWNAADRHRRMRALAAQSVGQARSAMTLAAAQTAGDYELRQGGIANSGTVEAIAPLAGGPQPVRRRHARVDHRDATRPPTRASRPAWHLTIATVRRAASRSGGC